MTDTVPRMRPLGLAARMILFLTLALVPIGVVAWFQTTKLQEETRLRTQLSLVALTETAALAERETVLRAQGGAQALGATLGLDMFDADDAQTCSARLVSYLERSPGYSFAALLTMDGRIPCTSTGAALDIEKFPRLQELNANPGAAAWLNRNAPISRRSVIVVAEPFFIGDELAGHVLLSVPSTLLPPADDDDDAMSMPYLDIVTINAKGEILSSRRGVDQAADILPAQVDLASLVGTRPQSFAARSKDGVTRVFASAPLVPGMVSAIGIWSNDNDQAQALTVSGIARALPLLMWAASVIVAFLAVNRLVIRHVKLLSRRMRVFARTRRVPETRVHREMPSELADMEDDFLDMADGILRDEAAQENALREKTILLKEVHHRVKNNLQLISSIMNMQIRGAREPETRIVLQRLQDRIRSLATIHRNLYQTEDLGHVDAGVLLEDLVQQMTQMAQIAGAPVAVETELDNIEAVPDQAVPLSLLTAEALTNALKYGAPLQVGGEAAVSVHFTGDGARKATLEIINTAAPDGAPKSGMQAAEPNGLGTRLIQAFATQLGGTLTQGREGDRFVVRVTFQLKTFEADETTPTNVPNVPDF